MGSYVDSTLLKDERIVFETRLHGIIYLPGILLMAAGAFFGAVLLSVGAPVNSGVGVLIVVSIGALFFLSALIRRATSEFAVTDKRVIIKLGWLSRRTIEMNLSKVESVDVFQGIVGRMLGYGRIVVVGTGATREPFKEITNPMEFRRAVQSQST